MVTAARWCITINGYTPEEYQRWCDEIPSKCKYIVIGKEVAPTTGQKHVQGFISFPDKERKSPKFVKELFGRNDVHVEVAKGTSDQAADYCKKEDDYFEAGEISLQGKRTELQMFQDTVENGTLSFKDLRKLHPEVCAKYPRYVEQFVQDNTKSPQPRKLHPLKEWQQELYATLTKAPNDREIIFVVDKKGNGGKSWFVQYFKWRHDETTQILRPTKKTDMAYTVETHNKVFIFDAPRSKQNEYLQYDMLEELKDGLVFSGKYFPVLKRWDHPVHVVVMMNEDPDMTKLSADRYKIIKIN